MKDTQSAFSTGDYKRLSKRIREVAEVSCEDYKMLQALRLSYQEPLSKIFKIINNRAHKLDSNSVCTYRIKRIESIVSKLRRIKTMQVQNMADVAGCRCIMTEETSAIDLYNDILKFAEKKSSKITVKVTRDYIRTPKESGYRSIHLEVHLKSCPSKIIEIQIRSLAQHNWATLVEISDIIYKSELKEFGNKKQPHLYEFHQLLSKDEGELTLSDKRRIVKLSGQFKYLETLGKRFSQNILELREQRNNLRTRRHGSYYLISTDEYGAPEIQQFLDLDKAEKCYFKMFVDNSGNKNIVLTHFTNVSFEKISIAYSNYVMTYNATLFKILKAIGEVTSADYNNYNLISFRKHYKTFWRIITIWFDEKKDEIQRFASAYRTKSSKSKKKKEWSISLGRSFLMVWIIILKMQNQFKGGLLYLPASALKRQTDKSFTYIQDLFKEVFN